MSTLTYELPPDPDLCRPGATLGDFRDQLPVGAIFSCVGFYGTGAHRPDEPGFRWCYDKPQIIGVGWSRWEVYQIVERGLVVAHPRSGSAGTPGGHQHLMEWNRPLHRFVRRS